LAYAALAQALGNGQEDVVHDGLEMLADVICTLAKELSRYNVLFETQLTKLHPSEDLPSLKASALVAMLPESERTAVPKDPEVFQREAGRVMAEVGELRERIRGTQEVLDLIVLDLYGITELADRTMVLATT
jgi:hypothetical protein